MKKEITFTINGSKAIVEVPVNRTLLEMIREDLRLTGTKEACNEGECGACTVIMNGKAINSCLTLAVEADGAVIETVEGLASCGVCESFDSTVGMRSPLQQAFLDVGAVQCGYCTPGMLMSAKALIDEYGDPTEEQIKEGIAGNICRCTGYDRIVKAIKVAAKNMK